MYDYDQRRDALSNDGNMYCVPTSFANLFKYLNDKGLTDMDSGWGTSYSSCTSLIDEVGDEMNTSGTNGTSGGDAYDGLVDWVDDHTSKLFALGYAFGPLSYYSIALWQEMGCLVNVCYGYYTKQSSGKWDRNGGHCITVNGYNESLPNHYLYTRNPWGDSDLDTQSAYSTETLTLYSQVIYTTDGDGGTYWRSGGSSSDSSGKFLDTIYVMMPLWGSWYSGSGPVQSITFHTPWTFNDGDDSRPQTWQLYVDGADKYVLDIVEPGAITWNKVTGEVRQQGLFGNQDSFGYFPGAKDLEVGGFDGSIYVLAGMNGGDRIFRIDRQTKQVAVLDSPIHLMGIEWSDKRGLCGMGMGGNRLLEASESLDTYAITKLRPLQNVSQSELATIRQPKFFALDRDRLGLVVGYDAGGYFDRYEGQGLRGRRVNWQQQDSLSGFDVDSQGNLHLVEGNVVRTLDKDGNPVATDFNGMQAGEGYQLQGNFFMGDRAKLAADKYRN
ncbi:MAG: hypothetical protein HONBIEJF_00532 [Fimbriimonadaceae bacterium]|nr:hypothetical protein [Fimbriimonadaceae bacterium]